MSTTDREEWRHSSARTSASSALMCGSSAIKTNGITTNNCGMSKTLTEAVSKVDFLKWLVDDLANDGYSKWFAVAFVLCCIPLAVDIWRHGWRIEEDAE